MAETTGGGSLAVVVVVGFAVAATGGATNQDAAGFLIRRGCDSAIRDPKRLPAVCIGLTTGLFTPTGLFVGGASGVFVGTILGSGLAAAAVAACGTADSGVGSEIPDISEAF